MIGVVTRKKDGTWGIVAFKRKGVELEHWRSVEGDWSKVARAVKAMQEWTQQLSRSNPRANRTG